MPIYEYRCNTCNNQFELRQKFSDPPADFCPKCGGTVRKIVSSTSFSLKGAGWYGDGYGKKTESSKSEGEKAVGTEVATEAVSTDTTQKETTALPATQSSAPTQMETKSSATEIPTTKKDKAEVTSQGD